MVWCMDRAESSEEVGSKTLMPERYVINFTFLYTVLVSIIYV